MIIYSGQLENLKKHVGILSRLETLRRAFTVHPDLIVDWNGEEVVVLITKPRKRPSKVIWKCYREQGGGRLETPRKMTESQAIAWLQKTAHVEVTYVERNHPGAYFIFYKPRA